MKDNTNKAKEFLQKALNSLPNDNALQEARYHLKTALTKIEHVEKKRGNKAAQQQTMAQSWNETISSNVRNPLTTETTLDVINKMIDEENKKLEGYKLAQQKQQKQSPEPNNDEDIING